MATPSDRFILTSLSLILRGGLFIVFRQCNKRYNEDEQNIYGQSEHKTYAIR